VLAKIRSEISIIKGITVASVSIYIYFCLIIAIYSIVLCIGAIAEYPSTFEDLTCYHETK
jgi:hypothetical protein